MVEDMKSIPVQNSVAFLRLRDHYKNDLLEDSRLNKAAELAATHHLLLTSPSSDAWKRPQLKAVGRELRQWTKRVRQPGGSRVGAGGGDVEEEDEDEMNLAAGPMHTLLTKLLPSRKRIKQTPSSPYPVVTTTAGVKRKASSSGPTKRTSNLSKSSTPKGPGAPKKKRVSLAVTPKGKKTPNKKRLYFTPPKSTPELIGGEELAEELPISGALGEQPWSTPKEIARNVFKSFRRKSRKADVQKLKPAAGWKPFGTPLQRQLYGKDNS